MKFRLFLSTLLFLMIGCSGIKLIDHDISRYYSSEFLKKVEEIKTRYSQGEIDLSLNQLEKLIEESSKDGEKAFLNNLIGVIKFSKKEFDLSLRYFNIAQDLNPEDPLLTAQIHLNRSSAFYKLLQFDFAFESLKKCDFKFLTKKEQNKFHLLNFLIAEKLNKKDQVVLGLLRLLGNDSISKMRQSKYWNILGLKFQDLDINEKIELLDFIESEKLLSSAYLAFLEAEKQYYMGEREVAFRLVDWVKAHFSDNSDLSSLVNNFELRLNEYGKFDAAAIGIVLPLTGKRKNYGLRAMKGIDLAFQQRLKNKIESLISPTLHIRDSKSNPVVAANMVRDLIKRKSVSMIIGGLDSSHAQAEYQEAKKYGVTYISLDTIYMNRDKKDATLFEIAGSPQSVVNTIIEEDLFNRWGDRIGIFYSNDSKGQVFIDEFWRASESNNFNISKVMMYDKKSKNFKDSVSTFLNLKYKRERQEELDLWKEIYSFERRGIRRMQVLKPILDFDWVFLSSYPQNTVHLIPYFDWLDAKRVKFLGLTSWKTSKVLNLSKSRDPLYFVSSKSADDNKSLNIENSMTFYKNKFYEKYDQYPRLIEERGIEAMTLAYNFIKISLTSKNRNDFYRLVKENSSFKSLTGDYLLKNNLWIKKLKLNKIHKGEISNY